MTTLIASEGKHSIISAYAKGIHLDFTADSDTIFQQLKIAIADSNITAVIATDDYTTELAARIAKELGLPHNDPASVKLTQRKDLARDRLAQHQIPKPNHLRLDLEKDIQSQIVKLVYPVVVKPVGLSASRGVIRTNNQAELLDAIARIQNLLNSMNDLELDTQRYLLIEEFIPGLEVAVEAMLTDGCLSILTIFDKPDPLDGPFFEETYYITPTRLDNKDQEQIRKVLEAACQAYGLAEGPIHAECRLNQRGVFVIEIAARTIGGLCGRLLSFGTGHQLEELVLLQAMRRPLELQPHELAAGVLMIPIPKAGVLKRVEGLLEAQRVPYVDEINIQIREGHELIPLPEGASYLGFIFAHAATTREAELALREAHAKLKFIIAPIWKLEAGGTELPGRLSNNHQPQHVHQVN